MRERSRLGPFAVELQPLDDEIRVLRRVVQLRGTLEIVEYIPKSKERNPTSIAGGAVASELVMC